MMILIPCVFFIAFLFSIFGMGGGLFYMPLFVLFLDDYWTASLLSFLCIWVTSASAATSYFQKRLIDWRLVGYLGVPLIAMVLVSGFFIQKIPGEGLQKVLGAVLFWAGISMIFPAIHRGLLERFSRTCGQRFPHGTYKFSPLALSPLTMVIGLLAGISGIAGGVFEVPLMAGILQTSAHTAVATSSAIIFFAACCGSLGRMASYPQDMHVHPAFLTALLISAFAGGYLGPKVSVRLPKNVFKKICGVFVALMGLYYFCKGVL